MLSLALALGVGASALADGPPAKRPAPAAKKAAPANKSPAAPSKPAAAAPEAPKAMVERACTACHDLGTITQARHTAAQWPGVVQRMRANGADLTDAEVKAIQAYLAKAYSKP